MDSVSSVKEEEVNSSDAKQCRFCGKFTTHIGFPEPLTLQQPLLSILPVYLFLSSLCASHKANPEASACLQRRRDPFNLRRNTFSQSTLKGRTSHHKAARTNRDTLQARAGSLPSECIQNLTLTRRCGGTSAFREDKRRLKQMNHDFVHTRGLAKQSWERQT